MNNIRVVLVNPSHSGNIGATARAMKTMGMKALSLVSPAPHTNAEAMARAVGAADVLERANVFDNLEDAVSNCHLVIGTTARDRRIAWPALTPKEAANKLYQAGLSTPVALLFGRERTGLTNAELDLCHHIVTIPTDPSFSSLNLASAVQIMAYELMLASATLPVAQEKAPTTVNHADMLGFYRHLSEVLVEIGFLDPDNPRLLMRRLMRLFNRSQLDANELNILRGMLTAIQQTEHHRGRPNT